MDKNNPFKVPDNYFSNFKMNILSSLPDKHQKKKKTFQLAFVRYTAVAAVLALVVAVGVNLIEANTDKKQAQLDGNSLNEPPVEYASLKDDYYLFLEDEAIQYMYKDVLGFDDL